MEGSNLALCAIVCVVATLAALSLMASSSQAKDIVGDTQMWGDYEDEHFDIWGNVTVPTDTTLTLKNVTIVFHTERNETRGIRLDLHASLIITDGDDDPSTRGDASNITSMGAGWYLYAPEGIELQVRASRLENLGVDHDEPGVGTVPGVRVVCPVVNVRGTEVKATGCNGSVVSTSVDIRETTISALFLTKIHFYFNN